MIVEEIEGATGLGNGFVGFHQNAINIKDNSKLGALHNYDEHKFYKRKEMTNFFRFWARPEERSNEDWRFLIEAILGERERERGTSHSSQKFGKSDVGLILPSDCGNRHKKICCVSEEVDRAQMMQGGD